MSEAVSETNETRYNLALAAFERADKAYRAVRELEGILGMELETAAGRLAGHEAAPGVPLWRHLREVTDEPSCRLTRCSAHKPGQEDW